MSVKGALRRAYGLEEMNGVPTFTRGITVSGIPSLSGRGSVFYVHRTLGSNNNAGTDPNAPLSTIQAAIDKCTADKGDVIVCLPGASHRTTGTAINCNKEGITIMAATGVGNPLYNEVIWCYRTDTGGECFNITAPVHIIGLEIWSMATTGASVVFAGEGGAYLGGFSCLERCIFPQWSTVQYGIEFQAGAYNDIVGCQFEGHTAGILFGSTASNNPSRNNIIGCKFNQCTTGIAHKAGATPRWFEYADNVFIDTPTAIDTNASGNGIIRNNWYETAVGTTYDDAVATLQAAGIQFSGNHYSE